MLIVPTEQIQAIYDAQPLRQAAAELCPQSGAEVQSCGGDEETQEDE